MSVTNREPNKITIKLLIDSKSKRVLYAEAGKDFADFLFTLLSLPVGTVVRLLSSNDMVGTLGKLYDSFRDLNDTYIQPQVNKDTLLKPTSSLGTSPTILTLTGNDTSSSSGAKSVLFCSSGKSCVGQYWSDDPKAKCLTCYHLMYRSSCYVAPPKSNVVTVSSLESIGFVKSDVAYMVMDDLEVKPMSTVFIIDILNKFNVKDVGLLQEKTISLGMKEGLKLLKSSLETKSVLTTVFLEQ